MGHLRSRGHLRSTYTVPAVLITFLNLPAVLILPNPPAELSVMGLFGAPPPVPKPAPPGPVPGFCGLWGVLGGGFPPAAKRSS